MLNTTKWVWNLFDDLSNSPLGLNTWITPLGILLFHLDEIGSFLEDFRDAIDIFVGSSDFQDFISSFAEAFNEIKEPIMEIWDLINEVSEAFSEIFNSEDPEGQGTAERINILVQILKGLAFLIRALIIPSLKVMALMLRVALTPIKMFLTTIKQLIDTVKNSFLGKLLGWDKDNNNLEKQNELGGSRRRMSGGDVNNVRNLGQKYNNQNNNKHVVINQHFSQGSMPIDARNMTKKEAKQMFIGAFGHRRAVGSKGILK